MTEQHAMHEGDLDCIAEKSGLDRSAQGSEVSQIPVLISLPELATIASQRATEKKSLRCQTKKLRPVSWRRVTAGKMLVSSVLLMLTMATYWGLTAGNGSFSLPDAGHKTVQQIGDQEQEILDPAEMLVFPESSSQQESELVAQPPVLTGQVTPGRVVMEQVIVQPKVPVLTARRMLKPGEELRDRELRTTTRKPR